MDINGFTLVDDSKLNRAIHGNMGREGKLEGGVGENAAPEAILAEYDRLGGLVKKGKYKVKTGSFYDFDQRKPRSEPEVIYVLTDLSGATVEIADGEEIPLEVKAAEQVKEKKAGGVKKAPAKKKAKAIVDESEE